MRKLWILGVIGALALLPFSALAHTGDATTATLKLEGVIYITVTDEWEDLTIDQDYIAGLGGATVVNWGSISIKVLAMTNYKVYAGYFTDLDDEATEFVNEDHVVALNDGCTDYWLDYNSVFETITNPTDGFDVEDYSITFGTDMDELFTGSNNIATDGDTKTYAGKLDLVNLGDRKEQNIQFTIVFVVQDTST